MDKVVKFLEQYVHWLVLALALVWVSWQGYSYLYKEPLTVTVGLPAVTVTPGTVDAVIRSGSVERLDKAIATKDVDPPKPAKVLDIVTSGLDEKDVNPTSIVALGSGCTYAPFSGGGTTEVVVNKVKDVPDPLPPAMPGKFTARWTVISVPAAAQPAAPAAPAAGDATAAPVQPVMVRQDTAYFSGIFTVDSATLRKEFDRCYSLPNVPLNLLLSEFVSVELLREEKLPNGAWSAPKVIPPLSTFAVMPDPAQQQPPLTSDALQKALFGYKQWFEENQEAIIHPAFFQTAPDAEVWVPPGDAPPAAAGQPGQPVLERPFDPSRDIPRTPEQTQQKQAYQQNLIRQRQQQQQQQQPQFRRGPAGVYQPPGGYRGPFANGGSPQFHAPGTPYLPPTNNGVPPPIINPVGGAPQIFNAGGLPNQDVQFLVHDVTIQEGKVYRYAVRYKLFNPMWSHKEQAVDWVAGKFDMDSPDASNPKTLEKLNPKVDAEKLWTAEINVEPRAHIFVTHVNAFGANTQADFVVYTWKDGHWKETVVKKVMPGDPVRDGKTMTPWTVVDVRKDTHSNEVYVLLMDDHGVVTRRDEASDSQSPEMQKLKTEAGAAAAAR